MALRSISSAPNLSGKRVLVRVDFNVPLKKGKVVDDTRLHASLPTVQYLIDQGAKVILATHVGRPKGKVTASLKTAPIAKRFSELLGSPVESAKTIAGKKVEDAIAGMRNGSVLMIENVRFSADEKKNTGTLSRDLAALCDVFVLDGFAVAHRASASVVGVADIVPSYAGLLVEKEIAGLDRVLNEPQHPFVAVLGGAKIETKIPVMKNLITTADHLLVGGGLINTYLAAMGYGIGSSLVDKDFLGEAKEYCGADNVVRPVDVLVGTRSGEGVRAVEIGTRPHTICEKDEGIYDIGPATIKLFAEHIKRAQTLVWNGAMGYFEQKPYDVGTLSIARLVASRAKGHAYGVIGGGETLQAMDMVGMTSQIDMVSTGGGAMLEYLAGKQLPGIAALQ